VVDQAEKIKKFVPEAFWKIEMQVFEESSARNYTFKWCRGRIFDRLVAKSLFSFIEEAQTATVIEVKK